MSNPKITRATYNGRTEMIPDIWIVGRSQARQREGYDFIDAYNLAIEDWFEQSELAERAEAKP